MGDEQAMTDQNDEVTAQQLEPRQQYLVTTTEPDRDLPFSQQTVRFTQPIPPADLRVFVMNADGTSEEVTLASLVIMVGNLNRRVTELEARFDKLMTGRESE